MTLKKRRPRLGEVPTAKKDKKQFVGYPPYAPADDIMNRGRRVDADMENASAVQTPKATIPTNKKPSETIDPDAVEGEESTKPEDEFSVTKEDMEALGPKDLSLDMGEDEEELKHRVMPVDFTAGDLDIPGSELDDAGEEIGSEDEENNSYSLGGDDHNDLEEDRQ